MKCPHCNQEIGVSKGGLSLLSGSTEEKRDKEEKEHPPNPTPKYPVRGKAREYSKAFEIAWKAYPRREQKFEAYAIWQIRAREVGESDLLTLIVLALNWQKKGWAIEGYKYAPYFERYLKRRKWEDEPPPERQAIPRHIDDSQSKATDKKLAELRAAAQRTLTAEELADIRKRSAG